MDKRFGPGNMRMLLPTNEKRATYDRVKQEFHDIKAAVITNGYLRFEQVLASPLTVIDFPVLENQGAQRAPEQRLSIADAFCFDQIGVFAGTIRTPATAPQGSYELQTFASSAFGTAQLPVATILNSGRIELIQDSVTLLDSLDVAGGRTVGQAQEGVAGAEASEFTRSDSYQPLTPPIVLNGRSKISLRIRLNESVDPTGEAGADTVMTVIMRGFLAQNCSKVGNR
ncbi:MAG: hypothetical protein K0U78_15860 [Actinomycetia bacterium]|nr:hypothetical protein [Actinomycetes bacterium]